MVTDISSSRTAKGIYAFQGNNALFFFATEGANAGKAVQFASGPEKLTSHWPHLNGDPMPRPGVVAINGFPGWRRR